MRSKPEKPIIIVQIKEKDILKKYVIKTKVKSMRKDLLGSGYIYLPKQIVGKYVTVSYEDDGK